ncbi:ras association domain-containing protein 8-like isoform X2 [Protopterus annectens]|uniref:ras association domain-containing protein 8-like isoform X2 n=1 Tax=Protopterus annectens TaxID=7888 RepID=UPI001CFACF6C|nr:ras association domain-containing protein 8-like isoform X2 [Protopterus annectens]
MYPAVAMELKVWVDGVQRVVCGVSEETTCQEVVIALAQAIGQTGRYVLIQKLRDSERQLVAHERPLEFLAKCGQYANDVQFILQRTGPSLIERPSSDTVTFPPERTLVRASLPMHPKQVNTEVTKRKEPRKSMTFNLGPIGPHEQLPRNKLKEHKQNGMDLKVKASGALPSKDELFKMVLRQQEQLHALQSQSDSFDMELKSFEKSRGSVPEDDMFYLEQIIKRNETEIREEEFWQNELLIEKERDQELQRHLKDLRVKMDDCVEKLYELTTKTESLEREILQESSRRTKGKSRLGLVDSEETVARIKADVETKIKQSVMLEKSFLETEVALQETEEHLQAKQQELEELNKELRQCNLQQFILQTGVTVTAVQPKPEDDELPPPAKPQPPSTHRNGVVSSRQNT